MMSSMHFVCFKLNFLLFGILLFSGLTTKMWKVAQVCVIMHNMIIWNDRKIGHVGLTSRSVSDLLRRLITRCLQSLKIILSNIFIYMICSNKTLKIFGDTFGKRGWKRMRLKSGNYPKCSNRCLNRTRFGVRGWRCSNLCSIYCLHEWAIELIWLILEIMK
jgi:hypothetical protein